MYAHLLVRGRWHVWGQAEPANNDIGARAGSGFLCAGSIRRAIFLRDRASAWYTLPPSVRRECTDAHRFVLRAAPRLCAPRGTRLQIISAKAAVGLFFAALCIYSRGRFRSAMCPGS
jgi:hypothetical protein